MLDFDSVEAFDSYWESTRNAQDTFEDSHGNGCDFLGRWLKALQPANSFAEMADNVQAHIKEIRRLCEELLTKNVDLIKRSNESRAYDFFDYF